MKIRLTNRQEKILRLIIDEYIENGFSISSNYLIEKYATLLPFSSALIRKEMFILENEALLMKSSNQTGGRLPTKKAYQYYIQYLINSNDLSSDIKKQLERIFKKRNQNIQDIIDQTLEVISGATNMMIISKQMEHDEYLRNIGFWPISNQKATLVVVTNKGRVTSETILLSPRINLNDLQVCIELLNEKLQNTPILGIELRAKDLVPEFKKRIELAEIEFETIIAVLFHNFSDNSNNKINSVKGMANLVDFWDKDHLQRIIKLIEDNSIWALIVNKTKLTIDNNLSISLSEEEDLAIASINLNVYGTNHSLMLVGPTRLHYNKVTNIFNWLNKKLSKLDDNVDKIKLIASKLDLDLSLNFDKKSN